jgi:hypothetical protein
MVRSKYCSHANCGASCRIFVLLFDSTPEFDLIRIFSDSGSWGSIETLISPIGSGSDQEPASSTAVLSRHCGTYQRKINLVSSPAPALLCFALLCLRRFGGPGCVSLLVLLVFFFFFFFLVYPRGGRFLLVQAKQVLETVLFTHGL